MAVTILGMGEGMVAPAQAAPELVAPIRALEAEKPQVSIETNIVIDASGAPTGYVECAIKVKTPVVYYEDAEMTIAVTEDEASTDATAYQTTFRDIALAIQYNPDLLVPVSWDHEQVVENGAVTNAYPDFFLKQYREYLAAKATPITETSDPEDIVDEFMSAEWSQKISMPTERSNWISNSAAYTGGPDGLVTITASSMEDVVFEEETAIVVIRFLYRESPRGAAGTKNRPIKELVKADASSETKYAVEQTFVRSAHDRLPAGSTGDQKDFFWFAADALASRGKVASQILTYTSGIFQEERLPDRPVISGFRKYFATKEIYNGNEVDLPVIAQPVVASLPDPNATYTVVKDDSTRTAVNMADAAAVTAGVHLPMTDGSVAYGKARAEGQKGSYVANILFTSTQNAAYDAHSNVRFGLRAGPSYKGRGDGGIGGTQILFYDWDDTLIGALIVGGGDARAAVNDYVENNMVHPDLRASSVLNDKLGGVIPAEFSTAGFDFDTLTGDKALYYKLLTSKERDYSYRGKYAFHVGVGGAAGEVDNDHTTEATYVAGSAEQFPLTNKLDYVFYKHLNTITTVQTASSWTDYYTVSPLVADESAVQYPWCYGWAIVEDPTNLNIPALKQNWDVMKDAAKLEDTWTTAGVGELADLDTGSSKNLPTIPASATVTYPKNLASDWSANPTAHEPSVANLGYSYSTTSAGSNSYLRFADFGDMDKLLGENGKNVLIVKAVYEPGPELMEGNNYRMIEVPTYNKLNSSPADGGGAYGVTVTLERSSTERSDGYVRGVSRCREAVVRQDTTADQKWVEDELKGVKNDLENATKRIAQGLSQTTFTKVDIDNGEEVRFTLALSARQNKVDYWIIDSYGFSFVSGGQRSGTNYNRVGAEFTLDNYNYYSSADSDTTDEWFDCDYKTKNGSRGFVLNCTLSHILEAATRRNAGEMSQTDFEAVAAYTNLIDANLAVNSLGAMPDMFDEAAMQTKILAAAAACKAKIGTADEADFWDSKLGCASLTYHQLQHYILNGALIRRSVSEDTSVTKFNWCHLHKNCAGDAVKIPESWDDLIKSAKGTDGFTNDSINYFDFTKLEEKTHLRNVGGASFADLASFKTKLVYAVAAGCDTWVDIQYYFLHGSAASSPAVALAEAQNNYWWYDGAGSNAAPATLTALANLILSEGDSHTLADGTVITTWPVKFAPIKTVYDKNADLTEVNAADPGWISMTHNFVSAFVNNDIPDDPDEGTGVTTRYEKDDYDAFYAALKAAVLEAKDNGATPSDAAGSYYWERLQYRLLNPTAPWPAELGDPDPAVTPADPGDPVPTIQDTLNSYWWKDGGKRLVVSSVSTLLKAARQVVDGGDPGPLNRVTLSQLENFCLRATKTGVTFKEYIRDNVPTVDHTRDEEVLDYIIEKVKLASQERVDPSDPTSAYRVTDWNGLQYYLIHNSIVADASEEAYYYWWKDHGVGTAIDISSGPDIVARLDMLKLAIIRGHTYGDPKALASFTDADKVYPDLALIAQYPGSSITLGADGLPEASVDEDMRKALEFTSTDDVISAVATMMDKARAAQHITADYTLPDIDWYQIQYGIINGLAYIEKTSTEYSDAADQYWWFMSPTYTAAGPSTDPDPTEALSAAIKTYLNSARTDNDMDALLDLFSNPNNAYDIYRIRKDNTGALYTNGGMIGVILMQFVDDVARSPYYSGGEVTLTWAQIQHYFGSTVATNKKIKTPATLLSHEAALETIVTEWPSVNSAWGKNMKDGGYIPDMITIPAFEPTKALVSAIEAYYANGDEDALIDRFSNPSVVYDDYHICMNSAGDKYSNAGMAGGILLQLVDDAQSSAYYSGGKLNLTWAQIQHYFATTVATNKGKIKEQATLQTPEEALRIIVKDWGWTNESGGLIPDMIDISGV